MITITILFVLTFLILILSYYILRTLFSPTILSTGMFLVSELFFMIFYNRINYEISFNTILIIILSLIFTLIGEYLARTIYLNKKKKCFKEKYYIETPKYTTYLIFLFSIIIFVYRFYDLYKFSLTLGNTQGILGTLASTRLAYALGEYTGGNLLISLSTIAIELLCYAYILFFLNNLILFKKIVKRNLLPIFGYCLIAISFTNRTEFLKIGFSFIIVMLYLLYSYETSFKLKKQVFTKILKFSMILAIVFFGYGSITRDSNEETTIKDSIVSYSSAGIIGLDYYLEDGWNDNPYFGYYTMQNIYDFLGVEHDYSPPHNLVFFLYNFKQNSSNIYTSLVLPIQDFGIFGMLISRSLLAFICTKIFTFTLSSKLSRRLILFLTYSSLIGYMYLSAPIADRFYNYFLSPGTIIKYTVYAYIVILFFCKCKLVKMK